MRKSTAAGNQCFKCNFICDDAYLGCFLSSARPHGARVEHSLEGLDRGMEKWSDLGGISMTVNTLTNQIVCMDTVLLGRNLVDMGIAGISLSVRLDVGNQARSRF